MEQELVWITGASTGIGRACAKALAASGRTVIVSARRKQGLLSLVAEIKAAEGHAVAIVCDVSDEVDVDWAVKSIRKTYGRGPDILINNAGISPYQDIEDTTTEVFDQVINTNLVGNFLCAKAVLPDMIERGKGSIVQMLSIASRKGFAGGTAYGSSKFASLGFTEALREEVRRKGIRVIAVLPGATETPTWDPAEREEFHDRMMQPEDIAAAIVAALDEPQRVLVEELLIRPIGGDL
ncbi:MAG: SDR family oxidoreductase [Bacteroidetes bacterium]|nr:SDR family oxidoreductase [Bacteroidota bacterium]